MYIHNKYTIMSIEKDKVPSKYKTMDPRKSILRAKIRSSESNKWSLEVANKSYGWTTKMDRVNIIRKGLPYESIEVISKKANLTVKQVLHFFGMAQTTYNKKKKDKDLLSSRDSEVILVLTELFDFGIDVFNDEKEKFQRWLKKSNISLGGVSPESLFDSLTGIQEVKNSLNRIEYGNLA